MGLCWQRALRQPFVDVFTGAVHHTNITICSDGTLKWSKPLTAHLKCRQRSWLRCAYRTMDGRKQRPQLCDLTLAPTQTLPRSLPSKSPPSHNIPHIAPHSICLFSAPDTFSLIGRLRARVPASARITPRHPGSGRLSSGIMPSAPASGDASRRVPLADMDTCRTRLQASARIPVRTDGESPRGLAG